MSKQILAYGGFTPTMLKTRAEIPASSYINVATGATSGTTVNCDNIQFSQIANILGYSSGATSLSTLFNSGNVNKWSNFSPYKWYVSGSTPNILYATVTQPYSVGSFAGYDHTALAPYILSDNRSTPIYADSGQGQYWIQASVLLGQIDWLSKTVTIPQIAGIAMEWSVIGDGVIATQRIIFTGATYLSDGIAGTSYSFNFSGTTVGHGYSSTRTGSSRFYFCADSAHSYQELASIPSLSGWTTTMTYRVAPYLNTFKTGAGGTPNLTGYTITFSSTGAAGWNLLSNYTANNYVTKDNGPVDPINGGNFGTVTLSWYGCDKNAGSDGIGDLNSITQAPNHYYWYRKNGNTTWTILGSVTPNPAINNNTGVTNLSLQEKITWDDVVDIEVR